MNCIRLLTLIALLLLLATGLAGCNRPNTANSQNSRYSSSNNSQSQLIDLNSCSKNDLVKLPGIGDAYAQSIIDHRPYREKTDLLNRNIIPESAYHQIQDQVIARQH